MARTLILSLVLVVAAACSSSTTGSSGQGEMAGMAPMLSVERFLQAVNARDLDAMANLFGTPEGPISDTGSTLGCAFEKLGSWIGLGDPCRTAQEVELRMDAIAQILEHDDYRIVSESRVAGRTHPTTRVGVTLTFGEETVQDVPFEVVQTDGGRWMVQQIGLERVTER